MLKIIKDLEKKLKNEKRKVNFLHHKNLQNKNYYQNLIIILVLIFTVYNLIFK
jgi:hypothetical protein